MLHIDMPDSGVVASGLVDVARAIAASSDISLLLPAGAKYIALGGPTADGSWTQSALGPINEAISQGNFADYQGIVFDVQLGEAGLEGTFKECFAAAKSSGLRVMVTFRGAEPHAIPDGASLVRSFMSDPNIDYISPQLYQDNGGEPSNDFGITGAVTWADFSSSRAKVVPGIAKASGNSYVVAFFRSTGTSTFGYVQLASNL